MQGFPFDSHVTFDESGIPQYDRGVSSQPLRKLIAKLFTSGVMPNPSDNLQVSAGSDGMTVIVQKGFAVADGGLCPEENVRTLSVTASHPTLDRIDTVVVRWNENDDVRKADLHILQGVPAKNPVRPTLTRTSSIYELGLADIFVTKGVATITNEKITDTRMESSRCGIVSSVSEWDTTTIYQQIQSDLAGFKSNEQTEFMTWFNAMKDQLTTDAAGKLQTEIDDVKGQIQNLQVGGRNYLGDFNKISNAGSEYDGLNEGTLIDRATVNAQDGAPALQANKEGNFVRLLKLFNVMIGTKQTYKLTIDDTFDTLQFKFNHIKLDASVNWDVSALEKGEYIFSFTIVKSSDSGTGYGMTAKYIKLEKGNTATDWTPAPEDFADTPITNSDIDTILNS